MSYRGQCIGRRTTRQRGHKRPQLPRASANAFRVLYQELLKDTWPQHGGLPIMKRPWWATLAYQRHWINADAFVAVPKEDTGRKTGPGVYELMYADNPLFSLIPKDTSFSPSPLTHGPFPVEGTKW